MCLAHGQQRSNAGEARTRGLSVSSQAQQLINNRLNNNNNNNNNNNAHVGAVWSEQILFVSVLASIKRIYAADETQTTFLDAFMHAL